MAEWNFCFVNTTSRWWFGPRLFLHDTQRAEDIVQDFFVKLWEKPYSPYFLETLKSYLFTSIRNLALNQLDKIDPLRRACDVAYYDSPLE